MGRIIIFQTRVIEDKVNVNDLYYSIYDYLNNTLQNKIVKITNVYIG